MNVIWHPEIQEEIDEGVDFYFERDPGVEDEFIDAIEAATRKLLEDPTFPREFDPPYRRVVADRFPYQIIYRIEDETIYVIAVMQQNRQEGYWKDREERW